MFFDRFTFTLFQLCFTTVIMVDVVLWGVLYTHAKHLSEHPKTDDDKSACCAKFINYGSLNVHAANFFFMLIECLLNNQRMVPAHVVYVLIWEMTYGLYSWVRAAWQGAKQLRGAVVLGWRGHEEEHHTSSRI